MATPATVLLATVGSAGDVLPLIAVARALQPRVRQVHIVTGASHTPLVQSFGLSCIELGSAAQHLAVLDDPDLWHPRRGFEVLVRGVIGPSVRPLYELAAGFDPRTTLLVSSGVLYGARIAHEKLGLPWITLHLQPTALRSAHDTPTLGSLALPTWWPPALRRLALRALDAAVIDRAIGARVNPVRRELGLAPQRGFFDAGMHAPTRSLGLFADWFAPPQPDWPPQFRSLGFVRSPPQPGTVDDPALAAFLDAGPPPVAFTAGTAMQHGRAFFAESLAATRQLGRRALLIARDRAQLPAALPGDALHVSFARFDTLLPRVAALVHHGGVGTVAEALAAGIPQLVQPMAHDQPDNARRLQRLGVSAVLPPPRYRAARVADTLQRLLDSTAVAARCRELAARIDFEAALERVGPALLDG
jgi:rhamnosyltransferase subunit B